MLTFTGYTVFDGDVHTRAECVKRAAKRGASATKYFARTTTVVVWGDLSTQTVTDQQALYSQKLISVRDTPRHVHVISADGFGDLLKGRSARCVLDDVRRERIPSKAKLKWKPTKRPLFGRDLTVHAAAKHGTTSASLQLDMDRLDAGTKAHQETLSLLKAHLGARAVSAKAPGKGQPPFDAGWSDQGVNWIAEVKSISPATEIQQMRLGLGQLLDYRGRLAKQKHKVRAVLVLSKKPADAAWQGICRAVDVLLTWAPDFPGL